MFTLALSLQLAEVGLEVITTVLITAGLLYVTLHLAGVGASTNVYSRRR